MYKRSGDPRAMLGEAALLTLARAFPQLESLQLTGAVQTTDCTSSSAVLEEFARSCPGLTKFSRQLGLHHRARAPRLSNQLSGAHIVWHMQDSPRQTR